MNLVRFKRVPRWLKIAGILAGILASAGALTVVIRYGRYRTALRLVHEARAAQPSLLDLTVRRDLAAHLTYLDERLARGWLYHKRDVLLGALHREATHVLAAARGEHENPHRVPGHHVIVTVSRVDGAPLPTSVMVPADWNGQDALPLVLYLHAGGVRTMGDCFPAPSHTGALCVAPLARGSHDYLGVQMTAVEECLADVRRRYSTTGLFVMGNSQGGMGAWLLAQRRIGGDDLSGVSPWAANADPRVWQGLWQAAEPLAPRGTAAAARLIRASRSPTARVEQLASRPRLPIFLAHSRDDTKVPYGHSTAMVELLRKHGAGQIRFDTFETKGHRLPRSYDQLRIDWLLNEAGKENSPAARFTAVIPPLTFIADCIGVPPHRVINPLKPARLTVRRGVIETMENAERWAGSGPDKSSYPGPAGAAFDDAFALCLPANPPEHLTACADAFSARWQRLYGHPPRRADAVATNPAAAFGALSGGGRRTLVALGSPRENPVVREALAGIDVRVSAASVRLFGRTFDGEHPGVILLRPINRQTGVLVIWGGTPQAYRQLWDRFGQAVDWEGDRGRWWFDYAVFDTRTLGPETFLAVGYFNHQWQFDPALLFEGSEALRAASPARHWPAAKAATAADDNGRTRLSAVVPAAIDSPRGPVVFDGSAGVDGGPLLIQGKRFDHGLGVIPPAAITWRLNGAYRSLTVSVGLERTGSAYPTRYQEERVCLEIRGDGRLLASSPELSATSGVEKLTADLTGVMELELKAAPQTSHIWHYGPVGWGEAILEPAEARRPTERRNFQE